MKQPDGTRITQINLKRLARLRVRSEKEKEEARAKDRETIRKIRAAAAEEVSNVVGRYSSHTSETLPEVKIDPDGQRIKLILANLELATSMIRNNQPMIAKQYFLMALEHCTSSEEQIVRLMAKWLNLSPI